MAHMQYLVFNNENIPKPASYSVSLSDVEADSGGVTKLVPRRGMLSGKAWYRSGSLSGYQRSG